MDRARPCALEQANGAPNIERIAISGVGIDDQLGANAIADHADNLDNLAHAHETDVRPAEPCIRDRCARDVKRLEAGLFCDQCGERIIDARGDYDRLPHEARAQVCHIRHRYSPR